MSEEQALLAQDYALETARAEGIEQGIERGRAEGIGARTSRGYRRGIKSRSSKSRSPRSSDFRGC